MKPRLIPEKSKEFRRVWVVAVPSARAIFNANHAHSRWNRRTPGWFSTRKDARRWMAQNKMPKGAQPRRAIITASWKVLP